MDNPIGKKVTKSHHAFVVSAVISFAAAVALAVVGLRKCPIWVSYSLLYTAIIAAAAAFLFFCLFFFYHWQYKNKNK